MATMSFAEKRELLNSEAALLSASTGLSKSPLARAGGGFSPEQLTMPRSRYPDEWPAVALISVFGSQGWPMGFCTTTARVVRSCSRAAAPGPRRNVKVSHGETRRAQGGHPAGARSRRTRVRANHNSP
jgi:hypothetical protein